MFEKLKRIKTSYTKNQRQGKTKVNGEKKSATILAVWNKGFLVLSFKHPKLEKNEKIKNQTK